MAFKFSTGLRKRQCFDGSLKSILDNSIIRVYAGDVPAGADRGLLGSNTLLCEIKAGVDGVTFEATGDGPTLVKSTVEVWSGDVLASGEATFFRLLKAADTNGSSTDAVRIQGTVGGPGSDLTISNSSLIQGAPQRIDYFAIALIESA